MFRKRKVSSGELFLCPATFVHVRAHRSTFGVPNVESPHGGAIMVSSARECAPEDAKSALWLTASSLRRVPQVSDAKNIPIWNLERRAHRENI